jgi:hypothetical protein
MTSGQPPLPSWLEPVEKRRNEAAIGLLGAGAIAGIVGFILNVRSWDEYYVMVLALYWAFFAFVATGLWYGLHDQGKYSAGDSVRVVVLLLCALIGLDLFLTAAGYVYVWRGTIFGGWEEWQGQDAWRIYIVAMLALLGPVLILLGLLATRTEEHSQPTLRRIFYGANAVLAGQLVLLILLVVNVVGYFFLPRSSDWTKSKIYTLSPKSQDLLKGLNNPVKIYAILDSADEGSEILQLLSNAHRVNEKVQWERVLRGRQDALLRELMRRYSLLDPIGLLVVSGVEPNENSQLVKIDDIYQMVGSDPRTGMRDYSFKGEDALMSAISYLDEDKNKPIVYFLQGHGELDIGHSTGAARPAQRAGQLRSQLEKGNYEVKALRLADVQPGDGTDSQETVAKDVPNDATAVVIAGPRVSLEREALDALRRYVSPKEPGKKQGKLVVVLGLNIGPDNTMASTGLERFLGEYGVEVTNDRVLCRDVNHPNTIIGLADPQPMNRNALAVGLGDLQMRMTDVRVVRPRSAGAQPEGGNFQVELLLLAAYPGGVWADSNLSPALTVLDEYRRNKKLPRLSEALPIGVTVSEPTGGMRPGDPHAMLRGGDSKPRMVVIGNAAFASDLNDPLSGRQSSPEYYSLVSSSLAWLREKPSNIGIEGKTRDKYKLNETTDLTRMIFMPMLLMLMSIIGLGLGVWVVRRR